MSGDTTPFWLLAVFAAICWGTLIAAVKLSALLRRRREARR